MVGCLCCCLSIPALNTGKSNLVHPSTLSDAMGISSLEGVCSFPETATQDLKTFRVGGEAECGQWMRRLTNGAAG